MNISESLNQMNNLSKRAEEVGRLLLSTGHKICTVESVTGGGISELLTGVAGASSFFSRGFVCYSTISKYEMLKVPITIIREYGVISAKVSECMAKQGLLNVDEASIVVACTGNAGPTALEDKPLGLVYITCADRKGKTITSTDQFSGDRFKVREAAILKVI